MEGIPGLQTVTETNKVTKLPLIRSSGSSSQYEKAKPAWQSPRFSKSFTNGAFVAGEYTKNVNDNNDLEEDIEVLESFLSQNEAEKSQLVLQEGSSTDEIIENRKDRIIAHLYDTIDTLKKQLKIERNRHKESADKMNRIVSHCEIKDSKKKNSKTIGRNASEWNDLSILQRELAHSMAENVELHIRSHKLGSKIAKAESSVEKSKKSSQMAFRETTAREEKLRVLTQEKYHLTKEHNALKDHFVHEKLEKADLYREIKGLQLDKEQCIAEYETIISDLKSENANLVANLNESTMKLQAEKKLINEIIERSKIEKRNLVTYIANAREKMKKWKQEEIKTIDATREQAKQTERTQHDISITRYLEECQVLRDRLREAETLIQILKQHSKLSPSEIAMKRLKIISENGLKQVNAEVEVISAHARVNELERLLEFSFTQQNNQTLMLRAAEATIKKVSEEREVAALEELSTQSLQAPCMMPPPRKNRLNCGQRSGRILKAAKIPRKIPIFKDKNNTHAYIEEQGGSESFQNQKLSDLQEENRMLKTNLEESRDLLVVYHNEIEDLKHRNTCRGNQPQKLSLKPIPAQSSSPLPFASELHSAVVKSTNDGEDSRRISQQLNQSLSVLREQLETKNEALFATKAENGRLQKENSKLRSTICFKSHAATQIQKARRSQKCYQKNKEKNNAASYIQAHAKGRIVRKKFSSLRCSSISLYSAEKVMHDEKYLMSSYIVQVPMCIKIEAKSLITKTKYALIVKRYRLDKIMKNGIKLFDQNSHLLLVEAVRMCSMQISAKSGDLELVIKTNDKKVISEKFLDFRLSSITESSALKDEDKAAFQIQKAYRRSTRINVLNNQLNSKKIELLKDEKAVFENKSIINTASKTVQNYYIRQARTDQMNPNKAAVLIETHFRRFQAVKKVNKMRVNDTGEAIPLVIVPGNLVAINQPEVINDHLIECQSHIFLEHPEFDINSLDEQKHNTDHSCKVDLPSKAGDKLIQKAVMQSNDPAVMEQHITITPIHNNFRQSQSHEMVIQHMALEDVNTNITMNMQKEIDQNDHHKMEVDESGKNNTHELATISQNPKIVEDIKQGDCNHSTDKEKVVKSKDDQNDTVNDQVSPQIATELVNQNNFEICQFVENLIASAVKSTSKSVK